MAERSYYTDAFDGPDESTAPSAYEKMKKGPHEDDDSEAHDDEELNDGHYAAASEMMDAHKRNDHKAYAAAMHSFMKCSK